MDIVLLSNRPGYAFAYRGRRIRIADTLSAVKTAAAALPRGASKIAVIGENTPDWVVAVYAAWAAGAAVVPIDIGANADDIRYILDDCRPEAIVADARGRAALETVLPKLAQVPATIRMEELCARADAKGDAAFAVARAVDDLAAIVYTSGTTGEPKGVPLTFLNFKANIDDVVQAGYFFPKMRTLALLPFHHVLPFLGTMVAPLYVGGMLVFPDSLAAEDIARAARADPPHLVIAVPRFYEVMHAGILEKVRGNRLAKKLFALSKAAGNFRLARFLFASIQRKFGGRVQNWVCGGAALDREVWSDLRALGFNLVVGYGLTECAPVISFPRIGDVKIGSSGKPLAGVDVKIVDGEIAVRGKNITRGYFRKPEETARVFRDGWFFTGDLGHIDADGHLFVTGRKKEIIVLPNGKNLDPFEIERRLCEQSDALSEVGVVFQEGVLQAVLHFKDAFAQSRSRDALRDFARDRVILPYNRACVAYKRIARFACADAPLPRTRVGKLKRFLLPETLARCKREIPQRPPRPEPDSPIYAELKQTLKTLLPVPVEPDAHLELDSGLDSLGKIAFLCHVKARYGVEISEARFSALGTPRALAEAVATAASAVAAERIPESDDLTALLRGENAVPPKRAWWFHYFSVFAVKVFVRLGYRLAFADTENIPQGSAIFAVNHQSYLDGAFAALPLSGRRLRRTYFLAKTRALIQKKWMRFYARKSNVIVLDVADNVRDALVRAGAALRAGGSLIIFPEGTRTRDGAIAPFKPAFAVLAKALGVPVVPTLIGGAYEAARSRSSLPKFGARVRVKYLTPVRPEAEEAPDAFSERVRSLLCDAARETPRP